MGIITTKSRLRRKGPGSTTVKDWYVFYPCLDFADIGNYLDSITDKKINELIDEILELGIDDATGQYTKHTESCWRLVLLTEKLKWNLIEYYHPHVTNLGRLYDTFYYVSDAMTTVTLTRYNADTKKDRAYCKAFLTTYWILSQTVEKRKTRKVRLERARLRMQRLRSSKEYKAKKNEQYKAKRNEQRRRLRLLEKQKTANDNDNPNICN
jgi:hypothetical protein